ncbi:MAG: MFS transporter [Bacteroidales bacterium]|nr:MFS transporter [Bacteroidales bacterium]
MQQSNKSPWFWVPTLYIAEGIPYFIVNVISVTMFKRLGMSNGDLAMYTSLLYLPWVIKPLWSPFVDVIRTKRWWILVMQVLCTAGFAALALSVSPDAFGLTLVLFYVVAFASATHDIAADGFYMLALDQKQQATFVGIRSTFYRIASVFGQGVIVVLAGLLEERLGVIPRAWSITLLACAALFALITLWHTRFLPHAEGRSRLVTGEARTASAVASERQRDVADIEAVETPPGTEVKGDAPSIGGCREATGGLNEVFRGFIEAWKTFFKKPGVWLAIVFMLLYRLPEALSVKMLTPFLLDPLDAGGLGLSTAQSGLVYGTVGVIALTVGGILGGLYAAKKGLRRSMWPMSMALALPCAVYLFLALAQPTQIWSIYLCVALDQFGYGFGFTAYMLYMIQFSQGEFKTSHYSICTAFMALSMMLPGLFAGWMQEALGYVGFFIIVMVCCLATVCVTYFARQRCSS